MKGTVATLAVVLVISAAVLTASGADAFAWLGFAAAATLLVYMLLAEHREAREAASTLSESTLARRALKIERRAAVETFAGPSSWDTTLRRMRSGSVVPTERNHGFRIVTEEGRVVASMVPLAGQRAMRIRSRDGAAWTVTCARSGWRLEARSDATRTRSAAFEPAHLRAGGRITLVASGRVLRLRRAAWGRWTLVDPDLGVVARVHHPDAHASLQFELSQSVRDLADLELALPLALWIALEWDAVRFVTPSPA